MEQVEKGADSSQRRRRAHGRGGQSIEEVSSLIGRAPAPVSRQQSQGLQDMAGTLEHLDEAAQQNAALVEQETAAAESLKTQAVRQTRWSTNTSVFPRGMVRAGACDARSHRTTAPIDPAPKRPAMSCTRGASCRPRLLRPCKAWPPKAGAPEDDWGRRFDV